MTEETLKIRYNVSSTIDSTLDDDLKKLAEKYNFKWLGQGVTIRTMERDISFIREKNK